MTGFQTQILEVAIIIIFFFVAFKAIKEGIETFIEHLNAKSKNEEDNEAEDGNAKIGDDGLSNSHLLYCSNCGKSYNPNEHIRFCAGCGHKL